MTIYILRQNWKLYVLVMLVDTTFMYSWSLLKLSWGLEFLSIKLLETQTVLLHLPSSNNIDFSLFSSAAAIHFLKYKLARNQARLFCLNEFPQIPSGGAVLIWWKTCMFKPSFLEVEYRTFSSREVLLIFWRKRYFWNKSTLQKQRFMRQSPKGQNSTRIRLKKIKECEFFK